MRSSLTRPLEHASAPMTFDQPVSLVSKVIWWLTNDPRCFKRASQTGDKRVSLLRAVPFLAVHAGCLLVFWVGVSEVAVACAVAFFVIRMFFITAFYHRYFSHRAFQASRAFQFVMALLGCTAAQRGPLWWAGHHREHHAHPDTIDDPHSPTHRGFLYSHTLWFLTRGSFAVPPNRVADWRRFPELRWLEKFDWIPFVTFAAGCWGLGVWLESSAPGLGTSGAQLFVWGAVVSTVVLYHATYTINSLAHKFGHRAFPTNDDSRNNALLAVLTLGEGWHNNHHYFPAAARQGFLWWQLDLTFLGLRLLAALGLVRALRPVPPRVLKAARAPR